MNSKTPYSNIAALFLSLCLLACTADADVPVTISVNPSSGHAAISPYIYGTNQDLPGVVTTVRRQGGNRLTGYNWENNASNAGSDFNQQSDDFMTAVEGIPVSQENIPGITVTHFHDQSRAVGTPYSLVTLPMAGFVAADKAGPVATNEAAPSPRWKAVQNAKPSAFSTSPNVTDGFVYNDEFLNFLVSRYGSASGATGIKGYNLDNEPDLWPSTHPRLHPAQPTCVELVTKSIDLAKAVKRIDSSADTLGFVSYGFNGYLSFQNAPDWPTEQAKGPYAWFIDYFLDRMKAASSTNGSRLLDVLDIHFYTEHTAGGVRVNDPSTWENIDANKGRIQAPRSLWDSTFVENSWIGTWFSNFLPLLPRVQSSISTFYPGTKLSISEYNFGGESHVSGGLAQADALGSFGKQNVYLATWWQLHDNPSYIAAAFNLFLNYNGKGGKFGATEVTASTADTTNSSVYASVEDSSGAMLHLVVLNKNYDQPSTVTVQIGGNSVYTSGRVYAFDSSSATITERAPISSIVGNKFTYSLPALTAAHIVLTAGSVVTNFPSITAQPASITVNSGSRAVFSVVASGTPTLVYQWFKNGVTIAGASSASYSISSAQTSDAGVFAVTVSNSAGSVVSSNAQLTVTPASVSTVYQAELAVRSGSGTVLEAIHTGFHGTGYVNFPARNGVLSFNNINGGAGGAKTLRIRFANGGNSARNGQLIVNGVQFAISFPATGSWTTWDTIDISKNLLSGSANTIQLKSTGSDLANIDELTVL